MNLGTRIVISVLYRSYRPEHLAAYTRLGDTTKDLSGEN